MNKISDTIIGMLLISEEMVRIQKLNQDWNPAGKKSINQQKHSNNHKIAKPLKESKP